MILKLSTRTQEQIGITPVCFFCAQDPMTTVEYDSGIPDGEIWIYAEHDPSEPLAKCSDFKVQGSYLSYGFRPKKPLEHVMVNIAMEPKNKE